MRVIERGPESEGYDPSEIIELIGDESLEVANDFEFHDYPDSEIK